jgi:hypothetical protein
MPTRKTTPPGSARRNKAKAKVSLKETNGLRAFRARSADIILQNLPAELQGPMFMHILCADRETGIHYWPRPKMAQQSRALARRYHVRPVSARTIIRHEDTLINMGLLERERLWETAEGKDGKLHGHLRANNIYKVMVMALELLDQQGETEPFGTQSGTQSGLQSGALSLPNGSSTISNYLASEDQPKGFIQSTREARSWVPGDLLPGDLPGDLRSQS